MSAKYSVNSDQNLDIFPKSLLFCTIFNVRCGGACKNTAKKGAVF